MDKLKRAVQVSVHQYAGYNRFGNNPPNPLVFTQPLLRVWYKLTGGPVTFKVGRYAYRLSIKRISHAQKNSR